MHFLVQDDPYRLERQIGRVHIAVVDVCLVEHTAGPKLPVPVWVRVLCTLAASAAAVESP